MEIGQFVSMTTSMSKTMPLIKHGNRSVCLYDNQHRQDNTTHKQIGIGSVCLYDNQHRQDNTTHKRLELGQFVSMTTNIDNTIPTKEFRIQSSEMFYSANNSFT